MQPSRPAGYFLPHTNRLYRARQAAPAWFYKVITSALFVAAAFALPCENRAGDALGPSPARPDGQEQAAGDAHHGPSVPADQDLRAGSPRTVATG